MSTDIRYNAKEFDDLFKRMIAQTDERIAQVSCGHGVQGEPATSKLHSDAPETPAGIQPEPLPEPTMDDGYYDDEPLWSDTQTRIEQMNSIKGR